MTLCKFNIEISDKSMYIIIPSDLIKKNNLYESTVWVKISDSEVLFQLIQLYFIFNPLLPGHVYSCHNLLDLSDTAICMATH